MHLLPITQRKSGLQVYQQSKTLSIAKTQSYCQLLDSVRVQIMTVVAPEAQYSL